MTTTYSSQSSISDAALISGNMANAALGVVQQGTIQQQQALDAFQNAQQQPVSVSSATTASAPTQVSTTYQPTQTAPPPGYYPPQATAPGYYPPQAASPYAMGVPPQAGYYPYSPFNGQFRSMLASLIHGLPGIGPSGFNAQFGFGLDPMSQAAYGGYGYGGAYGAYGPPPPPMPPQAQYPPPQYVSATSTPQPQYASVQGQYYPQQQAFWPRTTVAQSQGPNVMYSATHSTTSQY